MIVNVHGCDGSFWCVHGPGAGAQGVVLGEGQVEGIWDAPVRTQWLQDAHQDGGEMAGKWVEWRDISLGFHVIGEGGRAYDLLDSKFRQAFDYREDQWDWDARLARLEVVSGLSGSRWLDVQLHDAPDFTPSLDPLTQDYGNPVLPLRAGQPMWWEPDVVTSWSTSGSSGSGMVMVSNPTDQPMRQKWIVTRGDWTLPDVSWQGPKGARAPGVDKLTGRDDSARMILMPTIGAIEGGATVDVDRSKLMVRDAHGTNLLGRMPVPGRYFTYVIPPYTPETELPVSVTGAPEGGAMVKLVQPRRWSRPYGLEL